jgi:hypothetical protein
MKVTIPFAYRAQVLFPRSDTPQDEVFVETLEVDVPEYRSGDIPVALTYRWRDGQPGNPVYLLGNQFLSAGRESKSMPLDKLPRQPGMAPFHLVQLYLYEYGSKPFNAIASWYQTGKAGRDPAKVTDWIRSDRDEAFNEAKSFFEGMVSLDGSLLYPAREPTIRVSQYQNAQVSVASYDIGRTKMRGNPLFEPPFHITQAEEAIRFAQARYGNAPLEVHFDQASLNIAIPEAFTFDIGRYSLEWAASEIFEALCESIRYVPDNRIGDWQDLRRLLTEQNSPRLDQDAASLIESLIPLVRNGHQRKNLSAMIQLWTDNNVVDIAFDRRPALPGA